ncbi:hypothetical protein GCM10023178_37750 [Actinomadura luteofluorescens]
MDPGDVPGRLQPPQQDELVGLQPRVPVHLDDDQVGARAPAVERLRQVDDRLGADRLDPYRPESLPQCHRKVTGLPGATAQPQRSTLSPSTPNAPDPMAANHPEMGPATPFPKGGRRPAGRPREVAQASARLKGTLVFSCYRVGPWREGT